MARRTWSPSMIPKAGLIEAPEPLPASDGLVLTLRPDAAAQAGCAEAKLGASMLDEIAMDAAKCRSATMAEGKRKAVGVAAENIAWTAAENDVLLAHWEDPSMPMAAICALLPRRTLVAVYGQASRLELKRHRSVVKSSYNRIDKSAPLCRHCGIGLAHAAPCPRAGCAYFNQAALGEAEGVTLAGVSSYGR